MERKSLNVMKMLSAYIVMTTVSYAQTLSLQSGWNLVGADSSLTIDELKTKVASSNLLVVQGQNKTYQKSYADEGKGFLNSFTAFEKGRGYWIKVNSAVDVAYDKMTYTTEESIDLIAGWNLINPSSDLNISEIVTQLGSNLEVIQGQNKTYQKAYVDEGKSFLNSFKKFEEPQGYWVKVASDTTLRFPVVNVAPTLVGTAKITTNVYANYHFLPIVSDTNNDNLTFSIENKPSWAEFNTTTGLLSGNPLLEGSHENIIISVSDGTETVSLAPFNIEVQPAQNIAHLFGKATQGRTYDYQYAKHAIDENITTYNHADEYPPDNWWQLKLPDGVKIHKIVIYNKHRSSRLANVKLYLNTTAHTIGSTDMGTLDKTLISDEVQVLTYDPPVEKSYILMQGNLDATGGNRSLHLSEVKVYGEVPAQPQFKSSTTVLGLALRASAGTVVGKVEAIDYQNDTLSYSIVGNAPFAIASDGTITSTQIFNHNEQQQYTFRVKASDGVNETTKNITVKMLNDNGVKLERWSGIEGGYVNDLTQSNHFQNDNADMVKIITNIDDYEATVGGSDYGQRLTTVLKPTQSGKYIFNLVADKRAELWLSRDDNSSNLKKIAGTYTHSDTYKDWNDGKAKQSIEIELEAGHLYSLKVLHKDGGDPNFVSVGWKKAEDTSYELIPANQLFLNVLDNENVKPTFTTKNITIDKWQNKIESIFDVNASDLQNDTLTYRLEGSLPFTIDENGKLRVSDVLSNASYTLTVAVSDGTNIVKKHMTITVVDTPIVTTKYRTNDNRPALSGYLPNNYVDGDNLSIDINGNNYTVTTNGNGEWSLEDDEISSALSLGDYNITLHVNSSAIVYENYFEVYGSKLQKSTKTMVLNDVDNIDVTVDAHVETPLAREVRVRGSSIRLYVEDGKTKLQNKSFRTIKSLLTKYKDENNNTVFKTLTFNQNILPYSENNLSSFANDSRMEIVTTSNQFDLEISFGGKECDAETPTDKTLYCRPTHRNDEIYSEHDNSENDLSEQQVYTLAFATYHHFYNSAYALETMRAWVEKSTYKGMDFSDISQSIDNYIGTENKDSYLYRNFMEIVIPEHHTELRSMRYVYAAQGMAIVAGRASLLGGSSTSGWASEWEGSLDASIGDYDTIHHEAMHTFGYHHSEGITYGWSHAMEKKIVNRFYTIGVAPVSHVPRYVFETKVVENKQLQITVHKTVLAGNDTLTFEVLSSSDATNKDYIFTKRDEDNENQITLIINDPNEARFFIRVFSEDSNEIMSQLISSDDITKI